MICITNTIECKWKTKRKSSNALASLSTFRYETAERRSEFFACMLQLLVALKRLNYRVKYRNIVSSKSYSCRGTLKKERKKN